MQKKSFSGQGSARTPLGELTVLHQFPSWWEKSWLPHPKNLTRLLTLWAPGFGPSFESFRRDPTTFLFAVARASDFEK